MTLGFPLFLHADLAQKSLIFECLHDAAVEELIRVGFFRFRILAQLESLHDALAIRIGRADHVIDGVLISRFDDVFGGVARVFLDDLLRRTLVLSESLQTFGIAPEKIQTPFRGWFSGKRAG